MRVFSFQDRDFVNKLLAFLKTNNECNRIIDDFDDALYNKKDIYGGKDFIYTFYNSIWQNSNTKEFLRFFDDDLYYVIHNYTGIYDMKKVSLLELEVPDNFGVLGVLGQDCSVEKLPDKIEHGIVYEYVLPSIKKDFIIEVYDLLNTTFNNEEINPKTGFRLSPRLRNKIDNKLLRVDTMILS